MGGGVVLCLENCDSLKINGIVVYLCVNLYDLWLCMCKDKNCLLLWMDDLKGCFEVLYEVCDLLYCECVDFVIEIGCLLVNGFVNMVLM